MVAFNEAMETDERNKENRPERQGFKYTIPLKASKQTPEPATSRMVTPRAIPMSAGSFVLAQTSQSQVVLSAIPG
jgi:hypothetical protein